MVRRQGGQASMACRCEPARVRGRACRCDVGWAIWAGRPGARRQKKPRRRAICEQTSGTRRSRAAASRGVRARRRTSFARAVDVQCDAGPAMSHARSQVERSPSAYAAGHGERRGNVQEPAPVCGRRVVTVEQRRLAFAPAWAVPCSVWSRGKAQREGSPPVVRRVAAARGAVVAAATARIGDAVLDDAARDETSRGRLCRWSTSSRTHSSALPVPAATRAEHVRLVRGNAAACRVALRRRACHWSCPERRPPRRLRRRYQHDGSAAIATPMPRSTTPPAPVDLRGARAGPPPLPPSIAASARPVTVPTCLSPAAAVRRRRRHLRRRLGDPPPPCAAISSSDRVADSRRLGAGIGRRAPRLRLPPASSADGANAPPSATAYRLASRRGVGGDISRLRWAVRLACAADSSSASPAPGARRPPSERASAWTVVRSASARRRRRLLAGKPTGCGRRRARRRLEDILWRRTDARCRLRRPTRGGRRWPGS